VRASGARGASAVDPVLRPAFSLRGQVRRDDQVFGSVGLPNKTDAGRDGRLTVEGVDPLARRVSKHPRLAVSGRSTEESRCPDHQAVGLAQRDAPHAQFIQPGIRRVKARRLNICENSFLLDAGEFCGRKRLSIVQRRQQTTFWREIAERWARAIANTRRPTAIPDGTTHSEKGIMIARPPHRSPPGGYAVANA
jgi:hypothetical protein